MEMAHLNDIQTAKVGIVLLLLQILLNYNLSLLEIIIFQFESTKVFSRNCCSSNIKNIYVTVYYH